jgi:hypothetical protein
MQGGRGLRLREGGWLRLILDARIPNAARRPPPRARLASARRPSDPDLSSGRLEAEGFREVFCSPAGDEGDAGDCFYNFLLRDLATWLLVWDRPHRSHCSGVQGLWFCD